MHIHFVHLTTINVMSFVYYQPCSCKRGDVAKCIATENIVEGAKYLGLIIDFTLDFRKLDFTVETILKCLNVVSRVISRRY